MGQTSINFIIISLVYLQNILLIAYTNQQNSIFLQKIDTIPPIFYLFLILFLIALSVILFYSKISKIKSLKLQLTEKEKVIEKQIHTIDSAKTNSDELKNIVNRQTDQLSELKKEMDSLQGRIDEKVLKRTSELHTLLEKTVESNRLKEAFLEKISREIRTPLNSILGFVNLLNDANLDKIDREYYLKFIRESGNNLLTLIDNIVDFTRLETGDIHVEYKKCNLDILIADLVDKYRSRIIREKSDVALVYIKPKIKQESLADCRRILNIIDQLLNNAVKFTKKGKITIHYEIEEDMHIFTVSDTGIGIEEIYQDIIFERFYQIETETREYFQGAGLGLTIAKGLTDLLNGKIEIKSEPGKGSDFILKIPIDKFQPKEKTQKNADIEIDWKNKTILIAEDEDSNYYFLEAILRKTNVNLLWAPDGVKFLEIMNQNDNIDLVLLDIKMPGINGFNAIKVIRQQNIAVPVIAQTAFNQPEDKQRCLDSGCDDYLAKPIDKELLISKISKYFNH